MLDHMNTSAARSSMSRNPMAKKRRWPWVRCG